MSFKSWSVSLHVIYMEINLTLKTRSQQARSFSPRSTSGTAKCSSAAQLHDHPSEETKDGDALILYIQCSSADAEVRTLIILVNSNVTLINRNILNLYLLIERKKVLYNNTEIVLLFQTD